MLGGDKLIKELTFGHATGRAAKKALTPAFPARARPLGNKTPLMRRLQAYAQGARDDFRDIQVDLVKLSDFQRRVLNLCRKIPMGKTLTYGQLAALAGSPRAARAVGNCLAINKIPLIIPCHRVVAANGLLGSYSALGGIRIKKRLLQLENPSRK